MSRIRRTLRSARTLAGVSIGVNWSWLLVLALVTLSLAATVFPEQNPGLAVPAYVAMAVAALRGRRTRRRPPVQR